MTIVQEKTVALVMKDRGAASAPIIIECHSRAKGERRAPGGAWWIGLAGIAHEAPDYDYDYDYVDVDVDVDGNVDLTKGYGMGSVTPWKICNSLASVAPGKLHGFDVGLGASMHSREAS